MRMWGTCVDGVSSHSECDLRFRETDIDGGEVCENFDDCGPMRAVDVERLVCDVFVGESGDKLVIHLPHLQRGEELFPGMTITFALIQTVEKIAG